MDAFPALNRQLDFIKFFYSTAEKPFKKLLLDNLPREDALDDPALDDEQWKQAEKGTEILGLCSLSLVSRAIQNYLRECAALESNPVKKKDKSWFENYCSHLEEHTTFRRADSPIQFARIEQINLCRNDFMHDPNIDGDRPDQCKEHWEKYPISRFDDSLMRAVHNAYAEFEGEESPNSPGSLTIDRKSLFGAIDDARNFCAFVEKHRKSRRTNAVEE